MQENISKTLLTLKSQLVSDGKRTKSSLSLAQAIQSQMVKMPNQTPLGLAMILHYRFGSKDLLNILSESTFVASCDKARRFKHSAAGFTGQQNWTAQSLTKNGGIIMTWTVMTEQVSQQFCITKFLTFS